MALLPHPVRSRAPGVLFTRRGGQGLAGVVVLTSLAMLLGRPLDEFSYDLAYLVRPPTTPEEAVIITMDLQSHIDLKQQPDGLWSRELHARLLDRVSAHKPRAIVFDTFFMEPEVQGPEADTALVQAVRRAGNVVVAANADHYGRDGVVGTQVVPPFAPLRSVARWGPPRYPEAGAVRRSVPTIAGHPNLAHTVHDMLAPGTTREGTESRRATWFNFYGPPGSLPRIPYAAVLRGEYDPDRFKDRIVLVGADYKGPFPTGGVPASRSGFDTLATPYTRFTRSKSPGVEVVATEILNLVRGDGLRRWPRWLEWCVSVLAGAGALAGFPRLRPLSAAAAMVGGGLLVAIASIAAVWWTLTWWAWWIPALALFPFALAWCLLDRVDRGREPASSTLHNPAPVPTPDSVEIPGFTLLTEIGRGAYGSVWLARDILGVLRAIKIVRRGNLPDATAYEREFQGIRHFSPISLRHPGFTPILAVGRDDARGFFHYVMEAADDQATGTAIDPAAYAPRTLRSEIDRHGRLSVAETVRVGLAIGEALDHLHQHRLVHRDVKPANVIYIGGQPRLADVGLVTGLARHPSEVSLVGTPDYLPDEGPGAVTADVFALGKLLFVAVTGRPAAHFGQLPTDFHQRPDAPAFRELNQVLLTACDPDPAQRFPSMRHFGDALLRIRP